MSPVGASFLPFPRNAGTNLLHPRPPPQSLNGSEAMRVGAAGGDLQRFLED